jgi:hypothetical protein
MRQGEAVALIDACGSDNVDTFYYSGVTHDGKPFSGMCHFDDLPPANEVAQGELELCDEDGRELLIALGPGGVVSGIRLRSPYPLEEFSHSLSSWLGP